MPHRPNKIKNGNTDYVKGSTTRPKGDNSPGSPMGLLHSEKNQSLVYITYILQNFILKEAQFYLIK